MINEETLGKMYEGLIEDKELTTKELNNYGFNSMDLTKLIDNGVLERIKRGYYSFNSINDLFNYGKQLINEKDYEKAMTCFEKCYELDSTYMDACFELFLSAVNTHNYKKAFEYFEKFYNTDNKYYNADSNFYLYLLNMITDIPENHKEYARFIQFEDVRINVNDKRYNNIQVQNRIRTAALKKKFPFALKQLKESIKENNKLTIQDRIVRTLLYQAIESQSKIRKITNTLILNKKYSDAINYLENLEESKGLCISDQYTLQLLNDLNNIIETGKSQKIQVYSTDKLYDAINGKNYDLALSLCSEHLKRSNINPKDSSIYILLSEITKRLSKLPKIQKEVEPSHKEPKQVINKDTTPTNTFADIINYLMQNNLDNAFTALNKYLNSIDKKEYEFLIMDLIKISLIEKDPAFSKPMIALTYLSRENFEFNISYYIQNFYEALSQNKFAEARLYLDIISKSNKLGQTCILTEGLEQILNTTENMLNNNKINVLNQSNNNIDNKQASAQTPITKKEVNLEKEDNIVKPIVDVKRKIPVPIKKTIKPQNQETKDFNDEKFINSKLEQLYKNGIVLLKPMDITRRKNIHKVASNIPNVVSFSIGTDKDRQIVLRFKPVTEERLDIGTISKEGGEAYRLGNYDLCISKYKELLKVGDPKAFVYAKLGLSYMKKFNKDLAIEYLTIANDLAKKEKSNFDYTELIETLKGIRTTEERKPEFKMQINEFENDLDNNYGIEDLYKVIELTNAGMNLNDACNKLGLDENQKCIIALIFAKNHYAEKNYIFGDQYIKLVEQTKNKSKITSSLLEEVRKNKKFYANRIDENKKTFVLTQKNKNN